MFRDYLGRAVRSRAGFCLSPRVKENFGKLFVSCRDAVDKKVV